MEIQMVWFGARSTAASVREPRFPRDRTVYFESQRSRLEESSLCAGSCSILSELVGQTAHVGLAFTSGTRAAEKVGGHPQI
ncbi:hypothetical protein MHYP_G00214850 [Metynnis hypsauchen]